MQRRRFLQMALGSPVLAGLGLRAAAVGAQDLTRAPARAAEPENVRLRLVPGLDPDTILGKVVAVTDLIPAGTLLRSNRDPLPAARAGERLNAGMLALLGPQPWSRLFSPQDTVAIKVNGLASGHLSPRPELVQAVVDGIRSAGVAAEQIIIWDRTTRELERSGFRSQTGATGVRVYGTDALRGGGYADEIESCGEVGSFVTRILTQYATGLVNIGVLKDHDLAGVSAGMKSLYGAIHNPNRYHDHACNPYVARVAGLPTIRARLRLTVIDAVLGQAEAGPAYAPQWIWPCNRLLLAIDPVACDRLAWDLIEAERARRGLPALIAVGRAPAWIATAARMGLGRDQSLRVEEA